MADKLRHPKKRAFLAALAECGNITHAAESAKIRRQTVYEWKDADPAFAAAMEVAQETAGDRLEQEARRRAVTGTLKPVFYKGDECGYIREYSDTLLIALLNANKPEKFKFRSSHELTGKGGGPIEVRDYANLNDSELDQLIQEAETIIRTGVKD